MSEPEAPKSDPESSAAVADSPELRLKQLEEEKSALFDQLLRRQADFENFRKRTQRDLQEFRDSAELALVQNLLPVLDAFERALAHGGADEDYRKGVELIYKQLAGTLTRAGLQPIEAVGQAFDPFLHDAVERVASSEHPEQRVIAELQRGYKFKQRVLRPALVRVAVTPAATASEKAS